MKNTPPPLEMEIQSSTDYDSFTTITSNRETNLAHVRKLAASIKKKNLMRFKPALINDERAVIDGQHRLEACRLAEEVFWFIQGEGLTKDDMAVLNTNQRNWSTMDFVNYFALEGNKPYKELCNLINKYPQLRWSMIIRLCGKSSLMREGGFTGPSLNRTRQVCQWMAEMGKKNKFCTERAFGIALHETIKSEPDFKYFTRKIEAGGSFVKCHSEPEYRKVINNLLK